MEMSFGEFRETVDAILLQMGMSPADAGLVRGDLQEYADAEEDGQTPQEMVDDWLNNGDVLRSYYDDLGDDDA